MTAVNPTTTGGSGGESCRLTSGIAGANLVGKQFYFCKQNSTGTVLCSTDGEAAQGILQADGTQYSGETDSTGAVVPIAIEGMSRLKMAAACNVGDAIKVTTAGKGTPITTGDKAAVTPAGSPPYPITGAVICAYAREAAAAPDDVILVEIRHAGVVPASLT